MSDDPGEGAYGHWHHNEYHPNSGYNSNANSEEGGEYNNNLSNNDGGLGDNQNNSDNPYG